MEPLNPHSLIPAGPHPLHGYYEALSMERDFTFWNSGRFESRYTGSCLEENRSGRGTYLVENGLLKLQFEDREEKPLQDSEGKERTENEQANESEVTWEPRHFEQLLVKMGGSEEQGQIDYFMVHRPGNVALAEKEIPNDVPAECGTPEWDCWRRTSEFLPYEEAQRESE